MLKRNIGVVVVGMLLGAQIGLAAAGGSAVPLGAEDIVAKGEPPVQTTFQAQHADSIAVPLAPAMPSNDGVIVANGEPPVQSTFKQQHRDSVTASSGNAVPLDAEAIVYKGEPRI